VDTDSGDRPASETNQTFATPLKVGVDMSISQQPFAGSSRWAFGLVGALADRPELDLEAWKGLSRVRRGGPARKLANLAAERYWYDMAMPRLARRSDRRVLLMPVNLTAGRTRLPQVVTIHDVNSMILPGTYDPAYAKYVRWQFAISARRAERITTVSGHSREQISRFLDVDPSRITVIYPGLGRPDTTVRPAPLPTPYGLYVGATEPHKDVATAVAAWRALGDLDLHLAIVGKPGRDHARIEELAAHSGGRIHVVGQVTDSDLEGWYQHASVFVFPSRAEGFGYPPLEAMQRGVPVVAANSGSLPEVLGDAALYHQAGDSDELATQVRRAVGDAALRERLVHDGREMSSAYTWDRAAAAMSRILVEAAEGMIHRDTPDAARE
jgi:glycosyltransferase involved in cell wall biosynthesis